MPKMICHNWMLNDENWEYEIICPKCHHTIFIDGNKKIQIGDTMNCSCGESLILGAKSIWAIIHNYKISASLQSREVGSAPTYEWTGLALDSLINELKEIGYSFTRFRSDVKGQPLFEKLCICFTTFGKEE